MVELVARVLVDIAPPHVSQEEKQIKNITMSVFGMLNWFYIWNPKANRSVRAAYGDTVAALTLGGIKGFQPD